MGQHKHNENCKLAKEGKLPPKKVKLGKRAFQRIIFDEMNSFFGFPRGPKVNR